MPSSTSPTDQPAIQLDNVSRHYAMGEAFIRAVDDVSLTVPTGEFLALRQYLTGNGGGNEVAS